MRHQVIKLVVVYCLSLNPYICRTLEMVPVDHGIVSIMECIRGGAIGGMTFELEHAEWKVRGWRCEEPRTLNLQALKDRVTP